MRAGSISTGGPACQELLDQAQLLAAWITARRQDGVPFLLLGDFNRSMDGKDAVLASLRRAAPLVRATEGRSSPCWGNESFVVTAQVPLDGAQVPPLRGGL